LVPPLPRYYWGAPTSRRSSRFTSFPSFRGITIGASVRSLRRAPDAAPGLDQRVVHPAFLVKTTRPPRFPGAPMCVRHAPVTPAGSRPLAKTRLRCGRRRSVASPTPTIYFCRGSIAWLRTPCVRFAASVTAGPRNTRYRLARYALPGRSISCWGTTRGFSFSSCVLLVRLHLAQRNTI
jgi:hypothetical protein